jgi:hypothetical protein
MKFTGKHYAWAHLLQHGTLIDSKVRDYDKWCVYGSRYTAADDTLKRKVLAAVRSGNVDWDKTYPPVDTSHPVFTSTFDENDEYTPCIEGVLVLKDGTKHEWGFVGTMRLADVFDELLELNLNQFFGEDNEKPT